jgi:hypothetical protein
MGDKKILIGKHPLYPGKTKITRVNFLTNFVGLPPQELEQKQKMFVQSLPLRKI